VHASGESADTAVERAPGGGGVSKGAFLHGVPLPSNESEVRLSRIARRFRTDKALFSGPAQAQHTSRAQLTST
ncbi:hypothetical protein, partial [Nocardia nova]|uniref:hypothetical protein n=1 Tax=Nocardia nova TaxID=37330 RepID=UPI001E4B7094